MDQGNPTGDAPIYVIPTEIEVPKGKLEDSSLDTTDLGFFEDLGFQGFKHVHFPPEGALVNVVWLPPVPKKEGIIKKLARKFCCASNRS